MQEIRLNDSSTWPKTFSPDPDYTGRAFHYDYRRQSIKPIHVEKGVVPLLQSSTTFVFSDWKDAAITRALLEIWRAAEDLEALEVKIIIDAPRQ